ncbi:MAG: immunoglobulin domain-containing protein [bacterium]
MRTTPFLILALSTACVDLNSAPASTRSYPTITTQPTSQSVAVGAPATFSVVATGDSITYQWYKNTGSISGATSATYTIPATGLGDAALYQVLVTNAAASLASDTVRLTVLLPQTIVAYRLVGGASSSTNQAYTSTSGDVAAVYIAGGGDFTAVNSTIKKSGNGTSASGVNAAVRVESAGHILMTNGSVSTDSAGATALSATGAGSSIEMYRASIATTGTSAYAILATLGASVRVERTPIHTQSDTIARATGASVVALLFNADTVSGALVADASSTITATLEVASKLTGTVQGAALNIDATSTWEVTANSVLTTLTLPAGITGTSIPNIIGNGFTVSYLASLPGNAALAGATYTLSGGGQLVPR